MKEEKLVIAITGTPGAGKSRFAKELNRKLTEFKKIEINDIVERYHTFSSIDEFNSKIVRLGALNKALAKEIRNYKKTIIVGHLAQELRISPDIAIVVRARLKDIIKRLAARGYEKEKIRENIVSEALNYCGTKMHERCKNTIEVEDAKDKELVISYITKYTIDKKSAKIPLTKKINRMGELKTLIAKGSI